MHELKTAPALGGEMSEVPQGFLVFISVIAAGSFWME